MRLRVVSAYLVGLFLLSSVCFAEDTSLRKYQLAKRGTLEMNVPRSWKEQVRQPPEDLPPTIVFRPSRGNGFQVLITPMWAIRPGVVMPDAEEIRRSVTKAAEEAKSQAVESRIPIVELQGDWGAGCYFSATDRSPKAGEFKYLTQGLIRIGELAATFTILTNDGAETVASDALQMLKGARHVYPKAP